VRLEKYHGLGNDYLVLAQGPPITAALARAICDRPTGAGGDGILEPFETDAADVGVRIWNPDGSTAEKSGNGLRIFARWCVDSGRTGRGMRLHTGACTVTAEVGDDLITVDMGHALFDAAAIPARTAFVDGTLDGLPGALTTVGLGNPHAVFFVEDPDALPWRDLGAQIERHPNFPNRTNVQFAGPPRDRTITARIWERGAGETRASGSSSCAVAAAAVRTGRLAPGRVWVQMQGGTLGVDVADDFSLRLVGPVSYVGSITLAPAFGA
jgi:diaminopimelate epimerase